MIQFDYDKIDQLILTYREIAHRLDLLMESLQKVEASLELHWNGDAYQYYKSEFSRFVKNKEELTIAIKNIALFLMQVEENTKKMEKMLG